MSNSVASKYATFEGLVKAAKDSGYPMHVFVPYNGKIADITHADTNKHSLNLQTALSETRKIIAIQLYAIRVSGTGTLNYYWDTGSNTISNNSFGLRFWTVFPTSSNVLDYALSAANDDWDLNCLGYVVEL